MTRLFLLAAFLVAGGVALLGIPGAAWLEVTSPLSRLFAARHAAPDASWPMALMQTIIWPWFIPLAYGWAVWVLPPGRRRVIATLVGTCVGSILSAVTLQWMGGSV